MLSINSQQDLTGDMQGLIRGERDYTSKEQQRLTNTYWQEPGKYTRE
jgi:hypothetical protein